LRKCTEILRNNEEKDLDFVNCKEGLCIVVEKGGVDYGEKEGALGYSKVIAR